MVETRLLALGERWHEGAGPLALVGCGPGEHDTLPLIVLALALHRRGWRIVYLGADTPVDAFASAAAALRRRASSSASRDPERARGFDVAARGDDRLRRSARPTAAAIAR